jgi:RNA polymerase sigma factor (sigma-70 family)
MSQNKRYTDDDHFKKFAASLEREIGKHGSNFFGRQKEQLEQLLKLENEFRRTLIQHPWGGAVYRDFVRHICDEKRNILAARPFFRERQQVFTKQISKALKKRAEKSLYRFRFNYQFVRFVMGARKWHANRIGAPMVQLAAQIDRLRTEIIEMNMPLAISRARIFYSRTPKSHLTYMDFIQIGCEGLMSGLDKYVPEGEVVPRSFRGVAIGRMTGNFIEEYSETPIHFYPADKRKIYRANKIVGKFAEGVDYDRLADSVNVDVDPSHQTNSSEIAALMAAASVVSADSATSSDPEAPEPIARFAAPESSRPDTQVEERDAFATMAEAMKTLSVFERKLLRLRGVSL